MKPAAEKLRRALDEFLPQMRPPVCDVYFNATGSVLRRGTAPEKVVMHICEQITSPVLWEKSIRGMIADGIGEFYEVGPLKQITAMMKRIDVNAWNKTVSVEI